MIDTLSAADASLAPVPQTIPCHITAEVHEGVRLSTGGRQAYLYRCQRMWWTRLSDTYDLRPLEPFELSSRVLEGRVDLEPTPLARMKGGSIEQAIATAAATDHLVKTRSEGTAGGSE
ncbi:MAG: hypothetical protein V4755_14930 [Curtobacterium sp.]